MGSEVFKEPHITIEYTIQHRRGKMRTGICPFFGWENGISCIGTGIYQQKIIENGNGIMILARWALRHRDLCSGTMGFSQNLGWEMGIGYPLQSVWKVCIAQPRYRACNFDALYIFY